VRDRNSNRSSFVVAEEGTHPCLIIEVVSPDSRKGDRVIKVQDYARVGVAEYVYIDSRQRKGQVVWEIAGFRLEGEQYLPIVPDKDGAIYCESVGLRMGIDEGQVWLEDVKSGEELLTNLKAQQALRAEAEARAEAEGRAAAEAAARRALEARLAEMEAQLKAAHKRRK
jgi:hypothetical protein